MIQDYDPTWPRIAERLLADLRAAGPEHWILDHIGSTAVPGLAAKNIIDLQIRTLPLPGYSELDKAIGRLGYRRAAGSRPDSPAVHRDTPRGSEADAPDEVWEKRVYVRSGDPFVILHVRRSDSPWGRYTVWFRDWLRANPAERDEYGAEKIRLAEIHRMDADYDDYTRAKTTFLDTVQPRFEQWARTSAARR